MTLVDTNVLLDVATDDPAFADWSLAQLEAASLRGFLLINDVVYAELSVRYGRIENLDEFMDRAASGARRCRPRRCSSPARSSGLTDRPEDPARACCPTSFIGAHAAVQRMPLLTRDVARHRTYFPTVELIAPRPSGAGTA